MLKPELLTLELLEYRLADLRNSRNVRGGLAGTWELFRSLQQHISSFDRDERKRYDDVSRKLLRLGEKPISPQKAPGVLDDLVLGGPPEGSASGAAEPGGRETRAAGVHAPDPRISAEQHRLKSLARKVWWHDLDRLVMRMAASLRAERDRFTARLLYATHRNIQRYGVRSDYQTDVNLANFKVVEPMPRRDDPLVSVDDLDSVAELIREILVTIMGFGNPGTPLAGVQLPREQALEHVKRIALAVAADPYGGQNSLTGNPGPGSDQLRVAIQELNKEWLADAERSIQRRRLDERLQAALAFERNQRELFIQDTAAFTALMNVFFEKVARFLPRGVGGQASGPQLQGGVLFAVNPLLRLDSVPAEAMQLTVNIKGPTRFHLAGQEISISGSAAERTIYLEGQEAQLVDTMSLALGHGKLVIFREGDYLHLKFEDHGRSLAVLVAEALAACFVLGSARRDDLLTVLRILANTVVGEPQELIRLALGHISGLSGRAPNPRTALEGFIRGSARAARIELPENLILGLVQRFHTALTVGPADLMMLLDGLQGAAEVTVYPLTGEPLSITAGGSSLTVRQYRSRTENSPESLVVMLPGRTVGSFTDYLIEPLGSGTLLCVRGDQELAVIYFLEAIEVNNLLV
jgi:hypothetical protein